MEPIKYSEEQLLDGQNYITLVKRLTEEDEGVAKPASESGDFQKAIRLYETLKRIHDHYIEQINQYIEKLTIQIREISVKKMMAKATREGETPEDIAFRLDIDLAELLEANKDRREDLREDTPLTRGDLLDIPGQAEAQKLLIAKRHLLQKLKGNQVIKSMTKYYDDIITWLKEQVTLHEASLLEKKAMDHGMEVHYDKQCDLSGMFPIIGNLYKRTESVELNGKKIEDICESVFERLPEREQEKYMVVNEWDGTSENRPSWSQYLHMPLEEIRQKNATIRAEAETGAEAGTGAESGVGAGEGVEAGAGAGTGPAAGGGRRKKTRRKKTRRKKTRRKKTRRKKTRRRS
jgi:hypothetical protein